MRGVFAEHSGEFAVTGAIASDLELLAELHDREPSREWLEAARACPIQAQLGLVLESVAGRTALVAFDSLGGTSARARPARKSITVATKYANIY